MMDSKTIVDDYWSNHTVRAQYFKSQVEADKHGEWRLNYYPFYKELMVLDEPHKNEVVLDYGCGPGNDLIHFMKTGPSKIIGMDVSEKALELAKHHVSLYTNNTVPIEFIKTTDSSDTIPLDDNSVDYIICSGVLHHTSRPKVILEEFFRILKNDSYIRIMVYNRDSIFFHVYVAYQRRGGFIGNDIDEVFKGSTDGANCPISKAYRPHEFIELCNDAGFETEFMGGYLSVLDSADYFNSSKHRVLTEPKLNNEHKEFVQSVEINNEGHPTYNGLYCGIGGVYKLYKG